MDLLLLLVGLIDLEARLVAEHREAAYQTRRQASCRAPNHARRRSGRGGGEDDEVLVQKAVVVLESLHPLCQHIQIVGVNASQSVALGQSPLGPGFHEQWRNMGGDVLEAAGIHQESLAVAIANLSDGRY